MSSSGREPFREYLALTRSGELLDQLRPQVFAVLCVGWLVFMGLTVNHVLQDRWPQAIATGVFNILLFVNAVAYYRRRDPPVPVAAVMVPALVSLALGAHAQGLAGLLWAYPAMLLFHFLAPRLAANLFNLAVIAITVPLAWMHLGAGLALRMAMGLVLTVLFTNLFSYIADQQRQKEERQNTALREAMRMREEVERMARHDLKTPLNSIASVPRLLREHRRLDATEEELLVMVERSALRVLSMVNLSLDLYRMEEGSYRLRPQPLDLAAVADSVLRDLRAHAASKDVRLVLRGTGDPVLAVGEELLTYSLLANLLKNALEAAPDHGEVGVTLADDGAAWVTLEVHNAGAIPASIRARFFEKYATYGKAGGTGLGAYSARLMARMQHGELDMRSSEEAGTTLSLRLPRLQGAQRAQFESARAGGEQPDPALAGANLSALSVLLVDDDEYNILVLRSMLPSPPLKVASAINGRAALEAVQREAPDVILMDLEMPVMGGYAAARRVRELQEGCAKRSMLVAFSAHDDDETRRACAEAGFDSYLPKPATRAELLAVLQQAAPVEEPLDPELVRRFIASRIALAGELAVALDEGDRARARQLAHKISGGLAMYGFAAEAETARRVEADSGSGSLEALKAAAGELQAALRQLEAGVPLRSTPAYGESRGVS